jgi:hypothetical protein
MFWEVIVPFTLSRKVYTCVYMCHILKGFRDRAISLYSTLYRRATRHVLTRFAKCIDVDGGIFGKCFILGKLSQFCHLNNKYRY